LHGKNGQIWINGSQWLTGTSYQIELGRDFANVSVLGDAAQVWAGGLRGVTGSFEGLWDTGGNLPSTAAFLDVVAVAVYAAAGNLVASGDAWITVKVGGAVTDAVRCGGSIKGTGAWTIP
jgi:hypothetical protein